MITTGKNLSTRLETLPIVTLWKAKVHKHLHKRLSLVPVPSQVNPVHIFPFCFLKTRLNMILLSMPRSTKRIFPESFLMPPPPHVFLYHACHMSHPPP